MKQLYIPLFDKNYKVKIGEARRDRKNVITPTMKNLKMDKDIYALRKKVMEYIYRAKKLLGEKMPRVDVRITDADIEKSGVHGRGKIGKNVVWITKWFIDKWAEDPTDVQLHRLVFHELVHAVFGVSGHYKDKLMATGKRYTDTTHGEMDELFLKYARENGFL